MKNTNRQTKVIRFSIMWVYLIVIMFILMAVFFRKNYIFATEIEEETEETIETVAFEENEQSVDVLEVMLANTDSNKKLVNEQREVQYETEYEDNSNLPKGEESVKQEGIVGQIQVTAVQEYQDDELINEEIIETTTLEEVVTEIIYVGTSEFLGKYNVHINDTMYLLEAENLKEEPSDDSNTICSVPRYLDVTLKEAGEEWVKVSYNGKEGYLKTDNITSDTVTPLIGEKNRIARLQTNLNENIDLTQSSGFTLSDYKTVLTGNGSDTNKIFESNAETFYNIEQTYKINGIFVAAIGIHESAWGTSSLAKNKKNLFGYTAYSADPYNSATTFTSYEEAINTVAEALATKYLYKSGTTISSGIIATGTYYSGTTISSVNTRYASDTNWATKVYSYMQYLYSRL